MFISFIVFTEKEINDTVKVIKQTETMKLTLYATLYCGILNIFIFVDINI